MRLMGVLMERRAEPRTARVAPRFVSFQQRNLGPVGLGCPQAPPAPVSLFR